jgi:hypothetical protein
MLVEAVNEGGNDLGNADWPFNIAPKGEGNGWSNGRRTVVKVHYGVPKIKITWRLLKIKTKTWVEMATGGNSQIEANNN